MLSPTVQLLSVFSGQDFAQFQVYFSKYTMFFDFSNNSRLGEIG